MNFDKYTDRSRGFVQSAQTLAQREGHQQFSPEHLLKVMLDDPEGLAAALIDRSGGNSRAALTAVEASLAKRPKVSGTAAGQLYLDRALARAFEAAEKMAEKSGDSFVTMERLLLALTVDKDGETGKILAPAGTTTTNLEAVIQILRRGRVANVASAESAYEAIRKYTRDLNSEAREGKFDILFGRDEEIRRIIQVLSRRSKNSPVLVGEPGVGKTAIVKGLAGRIVQYDVPDNVRDKRVVALDIGSLIAGTRDRSEVEQRFKLVLDEIKLAADGFVLFLDEMHSFLGARGNQDTSGIGSLLKSALDAGELQCIGVATPDGYKREIEADVALARRLQPIFISEPTVEDTISILRALKGGYETHHRVRIADAALVAAAEFSQRYRYAAHRFLPDKAIDLVDEAAARVKMYLDAKPEELDAVEREIIRLKIEQEALKKEHDPASEIRLKTLETHRVALEKQCAELVARWQLDRRRQSDALNLEAELDRLRTKLLNATQKGDYQQAGEIQYALIPELEKKLGAFRGGPAVNGTVSASDVAFVVSRETGVPVEQILDDEPDKGEPEAGRAPSAAGKIFISYRRDDVAGHAGRIHDRLKIEFGPDLVFMDVDSIPLGSDFVETLRDAVEQCEVLLALIGPNWADVRDGQGGRRLEDPNDFVRIEIAAALSRDVAVIPILLPGASMPRGNQLPEDLRGLALRQALEVRHVSFQSDIDKLVKVLRERLPGPGG